MNTVNSITADFQPGQTQEINTNKRIYRKKKRKTEQIQLKNGLSSTAFRIAHTQKTIGQAEFRLFARACFENEKLP